MSRFIYFRRFALALLMALGTIGSAHAAGGAFAVDGAGVDDAGTCKIESWASFARNDDRIFTVAPACAVALGRPVELGLQFNRARSGGAWGSELIGKAKTSIVPFPDDAVFGVAISGGVAYDLTGGEVSGYSVSIPVSIRLAAPLLLNVNVGAAHDRGADESFFTWGVGFQASLTEKLMLIGEAFGQDRDRPGMQAGLRFTPHEKIDFDLVYGRNLTGERSDWVTFGVNLRF